MFLFVSDLHLDGSAPDAIDQFVAWLAGEARGAEAVYVLGDLFESWIGDDDDDAARQRACDGLRALTAAGVPCFVMRGNRDFMLGAGFEARTGCRLLPDPVVAQLDGRAVLLTHGDLLCTDDHAYQEMRSTVRDPRWQRRVLDLPLATRALLAGAARAGSKAHIERAAAAIMDVNDEAVAQLFRSTGADTMIHGHTHRPAIHAVEVDGRPCRRAVLGAWYEQGQMLRWREGQLDAVVLPRQQR
jgi:UDP-2,3-diacylglucosamine hydrolase